MSAQPQVRTRRRTVLFAVLAAIALVNPPVGIAVLDLNAAAAAATNEDIDLVFLMDGSGSISPADWDLQKDGYSAVIQDRVAIPRDGRVSVSLVQWADGTTRVEIEPVKIGFFTNITHLVNRVRDIQQIGGGTNPGDGIRTGTSLLKDKGRSPARWTLCMSTDGTTNQGESLDSAVHFAKDSGVDRYSVIGIDELDSGTLNSHYGPHTFGGGSVAIARNSAELASLVVGSCLGDVVELRAIEVNQAIQDWHNSVALVEDKNTVVRAFVQVPDGAREQRVVGRLKGTRNGVALAGSPLAAINTGEAVVAKGDIEGRRSCTLFGGEPCGLEASLNFALPFSWLEGTVTLEFEPGGAPRQCKEPNGPGSDAASDCKVTVDFLKVAAPSITFIGVKYKDSKGNIVEPKQADLHEQMARVRTSFPLASIDYSFEWIGPFDKKPSVIEVTSQLAERGVSHTHDRYYGVIMGDPPDDYGGLASGLTGTAASGYTGGKEARDATGKARNRTPHELAHTYGRPHAIDGALGLNADGLARGRCGEQADADTDTFAYLEDLGFGTGVKPVLGPLGTVDDEVWGLDSRFIYVNSNDLAQIDPRKTFEVMSYCSGGPQGRWTSADTYQELRTELTSVLIAQKDSGLAAAQTGPVALVRGLIDLTTDTATLSPLTLADNATPAASPGPYRVRFLNSAGAEIGGTDFQPPELDPDANDGDLAPPHGNLALILVPVGVPADKIARVSITHQGTEIGHLAATLASPAVSIISPTSGDSFSGDTVGFSWQGSDADGGDLSYDVRYSADDGVTWQQLAGNYKDTELSLHRYELKGSPSARLQVIVSDGVNTASTISGQFAVTGIGPVVFIEQPSASDLVFSGVQNILLEATVAQGRSAQGATLQWSSDRYGVLGTGAALTANASALSEGTHEITVTATDSSGAVGSDQVRIIVYRIAPPEESARTAPCAEPPPPPPGAIVGTQGNDSILGTDGDDIIYGLEGNDRIDGLGGNDTIFGGAGNDLLVGGPGNDLLCGGVDNDLLYGGDGNDALAGGEGDDQVHGELGDDELDGGPGTNIVDGGPGANVNLTSAEMPSNGSGTTTSTSAGPSTTMSTVAPPTVPATATTVSVPHTTTTVSSPITTASSVAASARCAELRRQYDRSGANPIKEQIAAAMRAAGCPP